MNYNQNTHKGPSFSIRNRLMRLIWGIIYIFFFKYTPRPFHSWRSFVLRIFGANIGTGVHIYPQVKIWAPWNLTVDDYSGIANGVIIYSQGKITIGKKVVISQGTHLCAGTHDYTKSGFPLITGSITIEDNVWIAAECFIHPNVKVSEGCVIGARSVVTKSMISWYVCAGHPCKPLKPRVYS